MKALDILKELQDSKVYKFFCMNRVEEAIKELEDLENKSCDGCKHGKFGVDSIGREVECKLNWNCTRAKQDKWELK